MAGVNQLLPFANSDVANVIPFDEWDALPARLSGFQSGIASSKQFNYILGQGGAAGYVIGQLVADYTTETATIAATPLYQAFKQALAAYVPTAIADGSIAGSKIANRAITAQKLASDAVTNSALADNSVGTSNLQSNSVNSSKIAAGAVGTSQIANDAVTIDKVAKDAVGSDQIVNGSVTFDKVASSAIATQAQAEEGTASNVMMTPQRTKQAIDEALSTFEVAESDGVTIEVNSSNKIQAKDIAIGGNIADLASLRGQLGNCSEVSDIDYNEYTKSGVWRVIGSNNLNCPPSGQVASFLIVWGNIALNFVVQISVRTLNSDAVYIRTKHGDWQPWRRVILDENINTVGLVRYLEAQTLSSTQKNQACENIGAIRQNGGTTTESFVLKKDGFSRAINFLDTGITKGTLPESDRFFDISFCDGSGNGIANRFGAITCAVRATGVLESLLYAYQPSAGVINSVNLSVGYDAEGNSFAKAPSTSLDAISNEIATANFVNKKIVRPLAWRGTGSQPVSDIVVTVTNRKPGEKLWFLVDGNNSLNPTERSCYFDFSGFTNNDTYEIFNPQNRACQMLSREVADETVTITLRLNGCSDMSVVVFGSPN